MLKRPSLVLATSLLLCCVFFTPLSAQTAQTLSGGEKPQMNEAPAAATDVQPSTAAGVPLAAPAEVIAEPVATPPAVTSEDTSDKQSAETTTTAATPTADENTPATTEAPVAPATPAHPLRTVEAIVIHWKGPSAVADQVVRSHIEMKEGDTFTQAALDRSIKSLFDTGFFENVYATPEEISPRAGSVTLTFELTSKLKIRTITFEGNHHLKTKNLRKEVGIKANDMLGAQNLADAVAKLKKYYVKRNFPETKIVSRTTRIENAGLVDVTFVIDEGKKEKVKDVYFEGNKSIKKKELTKVLVTKKDSWLSWLTGSGKLDDDNTTDDLTAIGELYRNKGFLEVKVSGPEVTGLHDGVALTYTIVEGPRYFVGTQSVEGNTIFTATEVAKTFKLKAGQFYSPAAIEATEKALHDLYGSKGYLELQIHTDMLPTANPKVLNVKYTLKEGHQFTVGTINIGGNTTTKSIVVARELLLAPGDTFSSVKMHTSEERLKNTAYFEKVNITDEPSTSAIAPDQHDMDVAVTEGKTGNLSFGVGFGSLDEASIFAELTQGNFDITNYKNMFRGGGQKFRLYLSLAQQSNQAILSFEEPWLFQRRIAGGFSIYNTETDYLSSEYNERRTGFEVYLRKRLVELVDARLGYRLENVDLFGIVSTASPAIMAEGGSRLVSKVTFDLTRDTRDKLTFTTRGNRLELDTAYAGNGLGGDTNYWSIEARGAQYFPSFEWPSPQTIILLARTGTMDSFSGEVPLFDRFFLGGPNTLRGFSYRKVGPTDGTGEPLGGKTYGFASAEYAFQVAPILQIATFYDAGFINSGTADFNTASYNDDWGVGVRLLLMGAPLRIDYGVPITSSTFDKNGGRFWFSFGTRF